MTERVPIALTVNGVAIEALVEPRLSLAQFVREELELTGTHFGCEHGVCGACTVRLNGDVVRGCLVLAVQAAGQSVETIEGASDSGELRALQTAFVEQAGLQCGFCTPGMLLTAAELLRRNPHPTRAEIRDYLSGNLCRCTGYQAIVDAITVAAGNLAASTRS
jgi:carbon-monoxide dehydrogenase small subunit